MDLNADVGEHDAVDGTDEALLSAVSSASVACGGHAGSPAVMLDVAATCRRLGVAVGAHPSYVDRTGFGRRAVDVDLGSLADQVTGQVGALLDAARAAGTRLRYVKAHGALYHRMAHDEPTARAVGAAVASVLADAVVLLPAGAATAPAVEAQGPAVAFEGFADRAYRADGTLVPRDHPGAVLTDADQVAAQACALAVDRRVRTVDGRWLALGVDSVCVHGDTPGASRLAAAVRAAWRSAGVVVAPFAP